MAKVTITSGEKKGSDKGVEVYLNGKAEALLAPGQSENLDVTLASIVTLAEVKLQKVKGK